MNTGFPKRSGRMDMGFYALNKLASAGVVVLLLSLLDWVWPPGADRASEWLGLYLPQEHWVYGYALTASLAADAILSFLPSLHKGKQAAVYGAVGFLFFALFTGGNPEQLWLRAAAGALTLLIFLWGKHTFSSNSLATPFFALAVPLLCWVI
ncbi:hypothetical protein OHJ21_23390 [Virgibacillus sp. LDC1]|uniref:hypothetical protein n=1 Tax=Paenibacillus sp. GM2FR TaxID=2059268 RepID=UPI000C27BECE|nr:hypothetical protein [Paenibacillus sp. GM2FR]MCV4234116.1 hypothetical protein [Virgibacillus sp. LDC1]PJN51726.1 hypothetical protein PAEVO_48180 [Paenibacillus sp. GM2FR]